MLRVLSIFGTRPEAVKMAPVVKCLQANPRVDSLVCVTAQHRQMLDQVLDLFQIQPDVDLHIMQEDQNLSELTARILTHLDPVLKDIKPDWILIQGDTTTVLAATILAYYNHIHIGHVEAGLRTHDKWQPFPEEINRRIASVAADLHFAPTETSRSNLLREGIPDWRIKVTGNPVIDALYSIATHPAPDDIQTLLDKLEIRPGGKRLILVTAHRRENFGKPLEQICRALLQIGDAYAGKVHILYPVHLNPNIRQPVFDLLGGSDNISLLDPVQYISLVYLIRHATLILTDSGGIQEEATALNIPTLVLREVTERPEGVEAGILKLVGADTGRIVAETRLLLDDPAAYQRMAHAANPFGDGHAAERIVDAILDFKEYV
jgi:UDP-N-acetylglucosamine 2-epimerase (non-hydrolysing)